jgi:AAA domain
MSRGLTGQRLSEVKPKSLSWIWRGRIPRGKITVLDGDPGLGKSVLTLDLAARWTTGAPMPDGAPGCQGAVILISAEDGLEDTIQPRLVEAGANLDLIYEMSRFTDADGRETAVEIPRNIPDIEAACKEVGAVAVIVDPLTAFLGQGTKQNYDQDVRKALHPVKVMAEQANVAVILIRHLNKNSSTANPLYRGGGSIGIVGAARSGLIVAKDPDDESGRILASTKGNLSRPVPSLCFRVVDREGQPGILWGQQSSQTAETLLDPPSLDATSISRSQAVDFLASILERGPQEAGTILELARSNGISKRSLDRAKARLNVQSVRKGFGAEGCFLWELEEHRAPFLQTMASNGNDHTLP